jgi:hypothetical protein
MPISGISVIVGGLAEATAVQYKKPAMGSKAADEGSDQGAE